MICRVGDRTITGRAVDLPGSLDVETVATAVRQGRSETDGTVVEVTARQAGPLHRRVGAVPPAPSIRPRTALAVAARSLGWPTPVDDDLTRARERLAAHQADANATATDLRRRLAAAETDIAGLRERVAEVRGRVQAGDAADAETGVADAPLAAAVRSLSEAETAAAAAREQHRAARRAARAERDRLEQRLRLADEVANLQRRARAHLVERARDTYVSALSAVPGVDDPGDPFAAPPDAMALAIARVGDLAAPVVLACGRFECARTAARWLDAPVCRLDP